MSRRPNETEDEVRQVIRDLIFELAPKMVAEPGENPHLVDDLEYHSLAILELAFTIEDEFELEPIDEETAQKIVTVRDAEDYVLEALREQAQGAPRA